MRVQMVLSQWWGGRGGRVVGVNDLRKQMHLDCRIPWGQVLHGRGVKKGAKRHKNIGGVSKNEQKGSKIHPFLIILALWRPFGGPNMHFYRLGATSGGPNMHFYRLGVGGGGGYQINI